MTIKRGQKFNNWKFLVVAKQEGAGEGIDPAEGLADENYYL